jgi:hypothetical protein
MKLLVQTTEIPNLLRFQGLAASFSNVQRRRQQLPPKRRNFSPQSQQGIRPPGIQKLYNAF